MLIKETIYKIVDMYYWKYTYIEDIIENLSAAKGK